MIARNQFPQLDNAREIPLTQGKAALVDAADFEWLLHWKWIAHYGDEVSAARIYDAAARAAFGDYACINFPD